MSMPEIDADLAVIDAALRGEGDGSELATLVADVRASAPRMSPALERRLEAIATRPARVRGGRRWWRLAPAGGVAIVVAGVIAAVVVNNDTDMTVSRENSRPLATQPDQTQAEPMGASGAHILRQPAPAAGVQSQSV